MLKELHNITPKKLRLELKETEAIKWTTYAPKRGSKLETPFEEWKLKPEYSYLDTHNYRYERDKEDLLSDVLKSADRWGYSDYAEETIPDFEPEERLTQKVVDEKKGKVYTIDVEIGEIIDESDLYIEEDEEGTLHYIDGDTGDEVGTKQYAQYNIPEMDREAFETFRQMVSAFPARYRDPMLKALDKMISEQGLQNVASAFMKSVQGRPNVLEKLMMYGERYKEAEAIIEDIANILDIPTTLKQDIRDYVYREQMSDIEEYGT